MPLNDPAFPWAQVLSSLGGVLVLMIGIAHRRLKQIMEQFQTNGGSSVRDQLNRIEDGQSANRSRIWAITEDSQDARWESDKVGLFVFMNRTGLAWLGRTFSDVQGNGWLNAVSPTDRDRVSRNWRSAIQEERAFEDRCLLLSRDGTEIQVVTHSHPIRDSKSQVIGWAGGFRRVGMGSLNAREPTA